MLRIALPNKGRLAAGALELLAQAGLPSEPVVERALQASLGGGELLALFMRARDIPELVADGAADVGITGRDLLEESGRPLEVALDLLFGRCRLAVAVREDAAAESVADLPPGTRVATSFPRLAARHFRARGREIALVPLSGAAEIAPHLGVADAIVDLVSTGSTLRTNGLRELEPVLESTALLVARPGLASSPGAACELGRLAAALESVIRARDKRYLMANVPRARLEETRRILPGITGPTVVDLLGHGNGHVAVHAVVGQADIYRTIAELKGIGAEGILVTRIERLMP
jgi:ATP phosphoribosyltransferase